MTKKVYSKFYKKLISSILIAALLVNSNAGAFAQMLSADMAYNQQMVDNIRTLISEETKTQLANTPSGQIEGMCKDLLLCIMLSGEEPEGKINPSISLLYMNDAIIEALLKKEYGKDKELDKEALTSAREQEKEALKIIKEHVRNIWKNHRNELKGKTLVKYFSYLVPSVYLADTSDREFKEYFKQVYEVYLVKVDEDLKINFSSKEFKIKDIKESTKQKELLGLGEILTGYSLVKGGVEENDLITWLALKSARSELSTIVVPSYITLLLEAGQFDLLEKYIDRLGYEEVVSSDTYSKTWFGEAMTLIMPSTHVKRSWNNSSSYAPGAVSRNGYYWDSNEKLHNMWEELPTVIASYGEKGEKLLNNIFYKDLVLAHRGQLQPHAEWNKAIIPFMIGAIGTNKIKARPYSTIEKGGSEYNIARYYGANIVGMVELGLLSYKFYDVPNYEYYKHVRNIIATPYWKEIQGKENKVRHNFEVHSHLSSQKGEFIGGVYNPENKTGLILHNSKSGWESGRNTLAGGLKAAGIADTVLTVYFTYELALTAAGLVQMVSNGVKLLKVAKSLKALGEKGNLLKIARNIRKGKYDYLIKQPKATKTVTQNNQVQAPKIGVKAEAKPQGVQGLMDNKPVKVDVNTGKITPVETAPVTPTEIAPLDPKTIEIIGQDRVGVYNVATGEVTGAQEAQTLMAQIGEGSGASALKKVRNKKSSNNSRQRRRINIDKQRRIEEGELLRQQRIAAEKQARISAFENKNWLARKWNILSGESVPRYAKLSPFETKLAKFADKYKVPLFLLTHPRYTVTFMTPAIASGVSVAHTPLPIKAPTEIVYTMPAKTPTVNTVKMPNIAPKTTAPKLANSNLGNMGKILPDYNFLNWLKLSTLPQTSPFVGALGGVRFPTLLDTPFVAVRKAEDARGGALEDDGKVPSVTITNNSASEQNAVAGAQAAKPGAEQVKQAPVPENPETEKTKDGTVKNDRIIFNNIFGLQNTVPLAQMQNRRAMWTTGAAAATIAAIVTLGLDNVFSLPILMGMSLAVAPLAMPVNTQQTQNIASKKGIKERIEDFWYDNFATRNNLQLAQQIKQNMPELSYHQVKLADGRTVSIADNYGFIAKSEYEKFYNKHFKEDEATQRLERKIAHDNLLAELIFKTLKAPSQKQLIWIMASAANNEYKILAAQLYRDLSYDNVSEEEIASYFIRIFNENKIKLPELTKDDIERLRNLTRRNVEKAESLLEVASPEDPILSGAIANLDILKNKMSDIAIDALYNASDLAEDIIKPLIQTQRNDYSVTYKNILPVHLLYNDGTLSEKPKIYVILSQPVTLPNGFIVAQDESTIFKFIVSDILTINKSNSHSRSPYKNPKRMYNLAPKDRHLLIESLLSSEDKSYIAVSVQKADLTPTNQDDLIALVKALEKDRLDWALTAIGLVAGADLAASLSSQFGKLIPIYGLMLGVAGFGYLSPKIANFFEKRINKWGNVKTTEIGLYAMLAVSALGITAGMWGLYKPEQAGGYGIAASVIFFTVAAIVASIFNTIKGPMLKSVYTDNTIFSSKNMNFDTIKALAKVLVAGIPAMFAIPEIISNIINNGTEEAANQVPNWISNLPGINWSVMVPITLLTAIWGLYSINHSRLKTEIKNKVGKTELKGEQNISGEEKEKTNSEAEKQSVKDKKEKTIQFENKWKNDVKPLLKNEYTRLFMIYLPYGIVQSIIIGQIAGLTLNKAALFITLTGSLVSWRVREGSKKLIKNKTINEDQLTGLMLPLMALSYIGLFLSPFDLSIPITSHSIPLLLSILFAYISTPALGTVENTRMMNKTVNYYNEERAKIEENTELTAEEKKIIIDNLNEEMPKMTKRASVHYNNGNASALWPVVGLSAIAILLLGSGDNADNIPEFSKTYLPMISKYFGGVNSNDIEVTTKLSFFKLFLSIAAGLATITAALNWNLTTSLFQKNKAKISQKMIDNGNITAKDLGIKADRMKTNINELLEDIKALNTDLTLNRISLSSEETVNKWLQSAISINNRLKFFTTDQDLANKLATQLKIFKETIVPNLKYIVNEVSPANNRYALSNGIKVSHYSDQFLIQYNALLNSVSATDLNYVEEGIKEPIKTLHFAKALIYRDGLVSLVEEKKHGNVYDGMLQDFRYLYDAALKEIKLYEKDNKIDEQQDTRIKTFKEQLNIVKELFMKNIK